MEEISLEPSTELTVGFKPLNKKQMKKTFPLLISTLLLFASNAYSQSFSEDKVAFTNFVKRLYTNKPFDGVKILDDYDHNYLVSVIALDKAKYTSESTMNRVAQVKSQSQANTFLNGATINMDMVIKTNETTDADGNSKSIVETIESIKQNTMGFSQGLELLTNFDNSEGTKTVFVFARELKK